MADDGYTRQIFQWQQQVLADNELTPLAVKIALALCRFINRQSRNAWPSQGTLAGLVHASRAGAQNALYQLAERGHLETTVNRGRGRSNTYRPALRDVEQEQENAYPSRHFNSENASPSRQGVPTPVGTPVPTPVGTNYLKGELFEEPSEISPSMAAKNKAAADKDDFEEWYQLFPKHVARGAAYKAYKRARAQGASVEELKLGAMRYAAQVTGRDPKFTKHPATWLNAECWKDEPDEQPTSSGPETSVRAARAGSNGYAELKRRLG
jgi:hypothetical protein